ncbi:MAG: tetratricopeptide repeat protein [Thermoanaerobaculia bacterium]
MPEPFSPEALQQLRQRWERDPKSRAFLQLAEEYRRAGRLAEAVHVLQAGLKEHPTYLSAQVALGRCLMESGAPDGAAEILERAVARDPTQLVANKLLVEAYLAKGQAAKASERLNLYKLFNDRDTEIEPLEARIRALEGLPPVAATAKKSGTRGPREAPVFDLPPVEALPEMSLEPPASALRPRGGGLLAEPFGPLHQAGAAQHIESAFAAEGIFALTSRRAEPEPAAPVQHEWFGAPDVPTLSPAQEPAVKQAEAPWPAAAAQVATEEAAVEAPGAPDEAPAEPVESFGIEPSAAGWISEPLPSEVSTATAAPIAASSTLGELYLAQGHLDEAEESFQSVLHARPHDAAALAGLESVRQQRGDEAAVFADEVVAAEESNAIVGGLTTRKAALLKDYLARFRRGVKRHVS